MTEIFKESDQKIVNRTFAIRLLFQHDEPIDFVWVNKLYKRLVQMYPAVFKTTVCPRPPEKFSKLGEYYILDEKQYHKIIISNDHIQYDESKNVNNTIFNQIIKTLFEYYITDRNIPSSEIKLIGKVSELVFEDPEIFDQLKDHYGLFPTEDLSRIELKGIIKRENLYIHLTIISTNDTDEDDTDENTGNQICNVKVDVNNKDQSSGLSEDFLSTVIDFADDFIKDEVIQFLNAKMVKRQKE